MAECKNIVKFPVTPTMNLEQAKAMFLKESVIHVNGGGVPVARVAELLGDEPARFAENLKEGYSNIFGIGSYQCLYLTYAGFLRAVTYANVMRIAQAYPDSGGMGDE